MEKPPEYSWEDENVLVDREYDQGERTLFEELLNKDEARNQIVPGKIVLGRVIKVQKDYVSVDVGSKSEGLIPISEFSSEEEYHLGREVEVFFEKLENEEGRVVLSKERAIRERKWEKIIQTHQEGSIVEGKVLYKTKGGLVVDIGIEAFLPSSQIENRKVNLEEYLGRQLEFKIIKINLERKNIVISRKKILEAEYLLKQVELIQRIEPGMKVKGVVKNIASFGAFLNLDGLVGLLHITDMSWRRVKRPDKFLSLGQELEVVILSVDKERGRIALGLKQLQENPWATIASKYPPGTKIQGVITNIVYYGVFIELEPGIEGLVHCSEFSWKEKVNDPSHIYKKGQVIEAIVKEIRIKEGRISLSIRDMQDNPWKKIIEKYPSQTTVSVRIEKLVNYGAFVSIESSAEGFIHVSQFSWVKNFSHPSEFISEGDQTEAIVLDVDKESLRLSLSIKNLKENPWNKIMEHLPIHSILIGKVKRVTGFGIFVDLTEGLVDLLEENNIPEGFIAETDLLDPSYEEIKDVIQEGQQLEVQVKEIDAEGKKILLLLKDYVGNVNEGI